MLANYLRGAMSPSLFAEHVLDQPLNPWQHEVAEAFAAGVPRLACCVHRQAGKTHLATVLLSWVIAYRPGATTLLISQDQRAASEVLDRARELLAIACPHLSPASDSATRLDVRPAGGRIISLPATATAVRGWAKPAVVHVDEAAFVGDDVFAALTAVLARSDGGQLVATSTPKIGAATQWFTRASLDPELAGHWRRFRYSAEDTGLLDPAFLEAERAGMTSEQYLAEYGADLDVSLSGAPFSPSMLAAASTSDLEPWDLS